MKPKANPPPTKRGPGTMDIILIIVGILLISFTVKMIAMYEQTGAIPDTLCQCVFVALGGECGIMGWIKTVKERNKSREWELADRNEKQDDEPKG